MNDIGIAILNYNSNILHCSQTLPQNIDIYGIQCNNLFIKNKPKFKAYYQFNKEVPLSWSRNQALRMMLNDNKKYMFIITSDVKVIDPDIFKRYIETSQVSGIKNITGPTNQNNVINTIDYTETVSVSFTNNANPNFIFIHNDIVKYVGYFDEQFDSTFSDYDMIHRLNLKNKSTPLGWIPTIVNNNFIEYIDSFPKPSPKNLALFKHKYNNIDPLNPIKVSEQSIISIMENLQNDK